MELGEDALHHAPLALSFLLAAVLTCKHAAGWQQAGTAQEEPHGQPSHRGMPHALGWLWPWWGFGSGSQPQEASPWDTHRKPQNPYKELGFLLAPPKARASLHHHPLVIAGGLLTDTEHKPCIPSGPAAADKATEEPALQALGIFRKL